MSALSIGGVVFACVFGSALLGMIARAVLPENHLTSESKDTIKVAMATIATLAALVVGLLIASAKGSFDSKDGELRGAAAHIVLLDREMAQYGPETADVRNLLRQLVAAKIRQIWPEDSEGNVDAGAISRGSAVEEIQRRLLALSPQNEVQRWHRSEALRLTGAIAEARWLVVEQGGSSIQRPFLVILVFWLAAILASFGLFAPFNGSVITALFVCALSMAGAVFLIVAMDQAYSGIIKLSSAPLHTALDQLGRP
jgi:hypothetical protein